MNATHLSVVTTAQNGERVADRVRRLQAEAQALAKDHVSDLEQLLESVAVLAQEIAEGGDVYPVGARDLCRRLVEDSTWRASTLNVILQKH